MASPPFNIGLLPDHLLLEILERLDLPEALRAGAVSTRWRHLPHQLSRLHLHIGHFHGATPVEMMDTFTGAARRLLAVCPPPAAACKCSRNIKTLVLSFYISDPPQLSSIGRTVKDVVSGGETEYLKFHIFPPPTSSNTSRNLRKMLYESWQLDNPPVHFGYVPKLRQVSLASRARAFGAVSEFWLRSWYVYFSMPHEFHCCSASTYYISS